MRLNESLVRRHCVDTRFNRAAPSIEIGDYVFRLDDIENSLVILCTQALAVQYLSPATLNEQGVRLEDQTAMRLEQLELQPQRVRN